MFRRYYGSRLSDLRPLVFVERFIVIHSQHTEKVSKQYLNIGSRKCQRVRSTLVAGEDSPTLISSSPFEFTEVSGPFISLVEFIQATLSFATPNTILSLLLGGCPSPREAEVDGCIP